MAMKNRQNLQIDWDKFIGPAKSLPPEELGEEADKIKKWLALADRMLGKSGAKKPPQD